MKSRLIVNPTSGTNSALDNLPLINERLRRAFGDLDVSLTIEAGDAEKLAAAAVRGGYSNIFVAGGDGTLNEVVNGVGAENGWDKIVFGLIPLGTGNDFAGALGFTENVEQSLDVLAAKRIAPVDVGRLNERFFINVSAGGFIAEVSHAVSSELKTIAGKFAYVIGGVQVFLEYEPVKMLLKSTGEVVSDGEIETQMFAVANSRLIGGGSPIAPAAVVDDGLLDVFIFRATDTLSFVSLLTKIRAGEHAADPNVIGFRARSIDLKFDREIKVNADGEVLSLQKCSYRVLPRVARFLCAPVDSGILVRQNQALKLGGLA